MATQFLAAVEAAFEPIQHFPLAAPARPHLAPGLRVTFHHPYAIYYLPSEEAVTIIRVLHGARDVATLAAQGGLA